MAIDKPSIPVSFWIDQPVGLGFKNTEAAIQRQTEQINGQFTAVDGSISGINDDISSINTDISGINSDIAAINTSLANKVDLGSPLSVMGATTSAQLAGIMTDETGSGALVFGTTPTLATPVINDPDINFGLLTSVTMVTSTITNPSVSDGSFTGNQLINGTITVSNTGLHLLDTNATHDLIIQPGSNLTADRVLTITTGDAARTWSITANLAISADLTVTSATTLAGPASDTVAGPIEVAVQSEMEAASSTTLAVTPGRQHYHPTAAKFWVRFSAGGSIEASYNVTSITKHATGQWTVNLTTSFSSANWCAMVSGGIGASGALVYNIHTVAAGSVRVHATQSNTAATNDDPTTPASIFVIGFGDQ